jgi:hypothetical protein
MLRKKICTHIILMTHADLHVYRRLACECILTRPQWGRVLSKKSSEALRSGYSTGTGLNYPISLLRRKWENKVKITTGQHKEGKRKPSIFTELHTWAAVTKQ